MVLVAPVRHTPTVIVAQLIDCYKAPLWHIHISGPPADSDTLGSINLSLWDILTDGLHNWGSYTHLIRVINAHGYGIDYLVCFTASPSRESAREATTPHVTAAQLIRRYEAPLHYIDPIGANLSSVDDLAAINAVPWCDVLADNVEGWPPYTHIIRVPDSDGFRIDYLVLITK